MRAGRRRERRAEAEEGEHAAHSRVVKGRGGGGREARREGAEEEHRRGDGALAEEELGDVKVVGEEGGDAVREEGGGVREEAVRSSKSWCHSAEEPKRSYNEKHDEPPTKADELPKTT